MKTEPLVRVARTVLLLLAPAGLYNGLAALPAGASLPRCATSDAWSQAETPRFVVYSNGGSRTATRVARQLERLAEVMAMTTTGLSVESRRPMPVYAFKDASSFSFYNRSRDGKPANMSGYFLPSPEGGVIALDASEVEEHRQVVFHEYTHALLHRSIPRIPLWLDEGLAEFFSACRLGTDFAETGVPIPQHLSFLATRELMDLDVLFGTDHDAPGYHEGERQGMIYAQSWALTHYLMRGMDDGGKGFADFFSRIGTGAKPYDSFFEAYSGLGLESLKNGLREYVRRGNYTVMKYRFSVNLDVMPVRSREMSRGEALLRLGSLLERMELGPDALEHLRGALVEDTLRGEAAALIGWVEERRGNASAADTAHEQAELAARGAPNPRRDFIIARGRMERFFRAEPTLELGPTPELLARARAHLERGLEADAGNPEALALLGRTYLMDREPPIQGISALTEAAAALPGRADVLADLVTLYANSGHREVARRILKQSVEPMGDLQELRRAEQAIVYADVREYRALWAAGDHAAAKSLLARARAEVMDPDLRGRMDAMVRIDAHNQAVERYNQGVAAINARRPRTLTSFEQARDQASDPELRKNAEARVAETRMLIRIEDAITLAKKGQASEARTLVREVLRSNPPKEIREYAERVLRGLGESAR